jgi:hypothetical protein
MWHPAGRDHRAILPKVLTLLWSGCIVSKPPNERRAQRDGYPPEGADFYPSESASPLTAEGEDGEACRG